MPSKPSSSSPVTTSHKEWQTSVEWMKNPCSLHRREAVISLQDGTEHQGTVTGCQDNSIQLSKEAPGSSEETKQWMDLKDIKGLLWR